MEKVKEFIELVKNNLKNNKDCGGWCIRCGLGSALTKLNDKEGEISNEEYTRQAISGIIYAVSNADHLMEKTRDYLSDIDDKMVFKTKKLAIEFLNNAIIKLKKCPLK